MVFIKKQTQSNAVIEDKNIIHVLLHCPMYELHRKQLYKCMDELCPIFKDLNDGEHSNYLLNSDGPIVRKVARFYYLAHLTHSSVNIS